MSNGFCGIDIAKDSFHAARIDQQGHLLWSRVFPMSAEGFDRFLEGLQPEAPFLGMESTGSYYLPLFAFLRERGLEVLRLMNPFTITSLRLLSAFPSKDSVQKASPRAVDRVLLGQGRGRRLSLDPALLLEAAQTSVGVSSAASEWVLQSKIRLLHHLQEEETAVTHQLVERCQVQAAEDMALLNSIPGLSDVSSAHFLAETHGRSFASPRQLIAFAGVDPAVDQSGQHQGRGRISKRGNRSLRRVLYLMAVAVTRVNPTFRTLYERKRTQGKPYVQAILAVVHKLIRVIHAMLAHRTSFAPESISL